MRFWCDTTIIIVMHVPVQVRVVAGNVECDQSGEEEDQVRVEVGQDRQQRGSRAAVSDHIEHCSVARGCADKNEFSLNGRRCKLKN